MRGVCARRGGEVEERRGVTVPQEPATTAGQLRAPPPEVLVAGQAADEAHPPRPSVADRVVRRSRGRSLGQAVGGLFAECVDSFTPQREGMRGGRATRWSRGLWNECSPRRAVSVRPPVMAGTNPSVPTGGLWWAPAHQSALQRSRSARQPGGGRGGGHEPDASGGPRGFRGHRSCRLRSAWRPLRRAAGAPPGTWQFVQMLDTCGLWSGGP